MKPLKKNSRHKNIKNVRKYLDSKGLRNVSSTIIKPGTLGTGILEIGELLAKPNQNQEYVILTNTLNKPVIGKETVKKYLYFFVKYENPYIPEGDEILYTFAVIKTLNQIPVNECSALLGIRANNITGLSEYEYLNGSFTHPTYINETKNALSFRYAEIAVVLQTTPGRLDDVTLGYPDFNYSSSPITTQSGVLPLPPYPEFRTDIGGTGATGISVLAGETISFIDMSPTTPPQVRPTSWNWDFGATAASPTGGTAQNLNTLYGATGTYSVSLTATNTTGSQTETKINFITVT